MSKKIYFLIISITLLISLVFPQIASAKNAVLYSDGFETGKLSKIWATELASKPYSGQVVSTTASTGSYSFRMEVRKDDPDVSGKKRAEIRLPNEKPLEEHWYAISVYLPAGGEEDYALDAKSAESIIQWHNTPDKGEEWTTPPLALWTYNGHYLLHRLWDDSAMSTDSEIKGKGNVKKYDLGSYEEDKGKWVNWVFHVKWGWLESQKPILEVYKNGVKVLDLNGLPNTTNDKVGVFMKVGVYKWNWSDVNTNSVLTKRVIYYDNIRVDDPNDTNLGEVYTYVAPVEFKYGS